MTLSIPGSLGHLAQVSDAESRSICGENRSGAKSGGGRAELPLDENGKPTGVGRDLGKGWKLHPCDRVEPGEIFEMADIEGPG
ncbi:MAG: hypothetical protein HRU15_00200, partial [Planctomycetes bacterium]|nr:hypothetical protein [Planctomycetota bacterium]